MASLFEQAGAQPRNPSRGKPIHVARMETGLFTNRSPLHDPASTMISRYYGGYLDALLDGSNMEISNALTLIRRPGNSQWTSASYSSAPDSYYSWQRLDGTIQVIVDTPTAVYRDNQDGSLTTILTKSAGAGQAYFQGVGNWLYIGDGVDLVQYDGVTAWQWGITAPTVKPNVTSVASGSAATSWQANTIFSTMGLTVDTHSQAWQLIGVNADGTNTTNAQFGTAGNGSPTWNQTLYGQTTEGSGTPIVWQNLGQLQPWAGSTAYGDAGVNGTAAAVGIYDLTSSSIYLNFNNNGGLETSGTVKPAFNGVSGSSFWDGGCHWFFLCKFSGAQPWKASTGYLHWYTLGGAGTHTPGNCVIEPFLFPPPSNQPIYLQVPTNTGTSGTNYAPFPASASVGQQQPDSQLNWLALGTVTRQNNHAYVPWTAQGTPFSVIQDTGLMHACLSGTLSGNASVTFGTQYGDHSTLDGNVIWVCLGPQVTWVSGTATTGIWNLPPSGWQPPQTSQAYGGSILDSSTALVEACISSGKSGTVAPTWSAVLGNTTDNGITWFAESAISTNSLAWTKGYRYGYSLGARLSTDQFNTTAPPGSTFGALGTPTGSGSGGISTSSPVFMITGGNAGAVNTVTGVGSTNPAVDTIFIWRTLDGGSDLFFLTEIPAPPAIGGVAQAWSFQDFQSDAIVNELIAAPIDGTNDPPVAGFLPMAYHFERIWGAVGQIIYCSGGGDVGTGNPNESFNKDDLFQFPSPCTRLVPTATGVLNFTTSNVQSILGGPAFTTFFPSPAIPGVGLLHFNALDIHGGVIYLFSADKQALSIDPSGGVNRIGGAIADKLAAFDPSKVYLTVHESGNDNCIIVADGSTGWYRLNPNQFPNGSPVWSPFATIVGGAGAVQSVETTKGVHNLLVGPTLAGSPPTSHILKRDLTTNQDGGSNYASCYFTMGSINFCNPGQIAGLTFLNTRSKRVGTRPTCAYLLNEISGSFTNFVNTQAYPWQVYGAAGQPSTLFSDAHYWNANGDPALAEHGQFKISFPAENVANEVLSLTVWGVIEQAPEI
jgi:hypothetical protein